MSHSAILWNAAHQASLSFTISWSLLKLMSLESVMPSNCRPLSSSSVVPSSSSPQSFPASGSFPMSQLFASGGQSIGIGCSKEHPGVISFTMDWLDLLAVQGVTKSWTQLSNTHTKVHPFHLHGMEQTGSFCFHRPLCRVRNSLTSFYSKG